MTEAALKVVDLHKSFGAHEVIKGVPVRRKRVMLSPFQAHPA